MKNNFRFTWATEVMNIRPTDHILEIGCGAGFAIGPIAEKLKTGHLLAIDRSKTMVNSAWTRNSMYVEAGMVTFQQQDLAELPPGEHRFNKIFAFNVNLFWAERSITHEASLIQSHLKKNGFLFLFYQPPSYTKLEKTIALVKANLEKENFKISEVLRNREAASCCIRAVKGSRTE